MAIPLSIWDAAKISPEQQARAAQATRHAALVAAGLVVDFPTTEGTLSTWRQDGRKLAPFVASAVVGDFQALAAFVTSPRELGKATSSSPIVVQRRMLGGCFEPAAKMTLSPGGHMSGRTIFLMGDGTPPRFDNLLTSQPGSADYIRVLRHTLPAAIALACERIVAAGICAELVGK